MFFCLFLLFIKECVLVKILDFFFCDLDYDMVFFVKEIYVEKGDDMFVIMFVKILMVIFIIIFFLVVVVFILILLDIFIDKLKVLSLEFFKLWGDGDLLLEEDNFNLF